MAGPLDNIIPSGLVARISSALVYAGYTVTSQPLLLSDLAIFFFAPKSIRATLGPFPGRTYFSEHVTFLTTPLTLYSLILGSTSSRL